MSRLSLLNTTCDIYATSNTLDAYNQPIYTYTFRSTQPCRIMHQSGWSDLILGKETAHISARFYIQNDITIDESDIILYYDCRWRINWINKLSDQSGATRGIQVDCNFIDFCEDADFMSSSSSYIENWSSSSSSESSSSSLSSESSSSSLSSESTSSSTSSSLSSESSSSSLSSESTSSTSSSSSGDISKVGTAIVGINIII